MDRIVSFLNNRYIIAIMVALFLLSFLRTMGIARR
jgi:multisubunit Na+/H+ antiporter MnhF subunit